MYLIYLKGNVFRVSHVKRNEQQKTVFVLRREGVEPPPTGWKPVILPLNYRRALGEIRMKFIPFIPTYLAC
jgi:hypothetical protein